MATQSWNIVQHHAGWVQASVTLLASGDDSNSLQLPSWPDKTIHVIPDSGVTITDLDIKGSNDNADWQDLHQLHDPTSAFTNLTGALLAGVVENPIYIKVTAYTASGGSVDTTIILNAFTGR